MDGKTSSWIFGACWVLGFIAGLYMAEQSPSQEIDTNAKAVDYFNQNHRVEGDSVCLRFCGEVLSYNAVRPNKVFTSPDPHFVKQESKFSFTAMSAAGTLGLLKLIGFNTPTLKEILVAAENNIEYKILAILGGGLGVGIGYYIKKKDDTCDCKNVALKDFLSHADNWKPYAPFKPANGVIIDQNAPSVRIIGKLPTVKVMPAK